MSSSRISANKWAINVKFQESGALRATATGILLVSPSEARALVTEAAGDKLFRVVQRTELPASPPGVRRVEVTNRAAIRVLAWKLWSTSNVIYEVQPSCDVDGAQQQQGQERVNFELVSSSMLQSLSGTWSLRPMRVHTSALPSHILSCAAPAAPAAPGTKGATAAPGSLYSSSTSNNSSGGAGRSSLVMQNTARSSFLAHAGGLIKGGSSILSSAGGLWEGRIGSRSSSRAGSGSDGRLEAATCLPPGLVADADGFVTATFVHYEQLAQPKGMPPGIRYVPGLSDAVAASIGKEVRQMLDKVACVSDVAVTQGLRAQEALSFVVERMEAAGGSFKSLQRQLRKPQPASSASPAAAGGGSASACDSARAAVAEDRMKLSSHPVMLTRSEGGVLACDD